MCALQAFPVVALQTSDTEQLVVKENHFRICGVPAVRCDGMLWLMAEQDRGKQPFLWKGLVVTPISGHCLPSA